MLLVAEAMQDKQALPELQHVTDSLGGLLMSGLGRFGLRFEVPPQPHDHALVIIFVVGGVSMREIRDVQVCVPVLLLRCDPTSEQRSSSGTRRAVIVALVLGAMLQVLNLGFGFRFRPMP